MATTYAFNYGYLLIEDADGNIISVEEQQDLVFTLEDGDPPFIYETDEFDEFDITNNFLSLFLNGFDLNETFPEDNPNFTVQIDVRIESTGIDRVIRLRDATDPDNVLTYAFIISDGDGTPTFNSDQDVIDYFTESTFFQLTGDGGVAPSNEFFISTDDSPDTDVEVGDEFANTINLGVGDDYADGAGGGDTISGGDGNDSIRGNIGDDQLSGNNDNDTIRGGEGNDTIFAGSGQDRIYDGLGDDLIYAGSGFDRVYLEDIVEGADTVFGGADQDTIEGDLRAYDSEGLIVTVDIDAGTITTNQDASGDDADIFDNVEVFRFLGDSVIVVDGGEGGEQFYLGEGNDTFNGSEFDELVFSYGGDDLLIGGLGRDRLFTGEGNDVAFGDGGGDEIGLLGGDDSAEGGFGNDTIYGVDGNDTIRGQGNDDFVWGGRGNDSLFGDDGNDDIAGFFGEDTLTGGAGNDTMYASFDDDLVFAGADDDLVYGGSGNDTMFGGSGNDTMFGAQDDDTMLGGGGDDSIMGNVGNDTINGGTGADIVMLGDGLDVFEFNDGDEADTVSDFDTGFDQLHLDSALWSELAPGTINSASDVMDEFGSLVDGVVTLDFGGGDVLTLEGTIASLSDLADITSIDPV